MSGTELTSARTAAIALLDLLHDWGVRHIFSCPGSTEAAVLDALVDRDDIELVITTHESAAVSMADGLARATRAPTVAYLHANVGLTNGLAHLYAAQLAYSPVVVLTGIKPAVIQSRAGFTTARRMRDLVGQFVKDDWQSLSAGALLEDVNRAFRLAVTEPAGPVWVGLAQDLLDQPIDVAQPDPAAHRYDSRVRPSAAALAAAADLLRDARTPVLVAGGEVARCAALDQLVALSERLGAPVLMEERRGFERPGFPTTHENFRGHYDAVHPLVLDADVIFFAGCRLFHEFEPEQRRPIPAGARVVHSHADATQIGRIHGVDVGLVADQQLLLEDLLDALSDVTPGRVEAATSAPATSAPATSASATSTSGGSLEGRLAPIEAVRAVAEALRGSIVVGDATTAGGLLQRATEQRTADDFFVSISGSLGWGMGAALGIKLARPDRHVAAVIGDGVFQFGLPALWTAMRYRIPVTFVVLNNQRYAAVGAALRRFGGRAVAEGRYPGTDLAGPHIADIAAGFGLATDRVDDAAALRKWLESARDSDAPSLIEVMTDPDNFGP